MQITKINTNYDSHNRQNFGTQITPPLYNKISNYISKVSTKTRKAEARRILDFIKNYELPGTLTINKQRQVLWRDFSTNSDTTRVLSNDIFINLPALREIRANLVKIKYYLIQPKSLQK